MGHRAVVLMVAALGLTSCTKYERMDPTGATKEILFEKLPAAPTSARVAVPEKPPAARADTPSPIPASQVGERTDLAAPSLDVVEFASGERLVGKVRELNSASVIVEIAGQKIAIERDKIRAIQFGNVRPP